MGPGSKERVKVVRRTTFMQVVSTERPAFMQVLAPERLVPVEAAAGRPAIRKATGLPPLFPDRPESVAFVCSHTRSPTHSPTPTAGVERSRRRWCGPVEAGAPEQERCTGGSRAVHGRSGFVTGALAAVKRPQAAKGGLERPLWDTKRAAAT